METIAVSWFTGRETTATQMLFTLLTLLASRTTAERESVCKTRKVASRPVLNIVGAVIGLRGKRRVADSVGQGLRGGSEGCCSAKRQARLTAPG